MVGIWSRSNDKSVMVFCNSEACLEELVDDIKTKSLIWIRRKHKPNLCLGTNGFLILS
ncbi:hypothetical protein Lalb_Chr02g0149221 [Lupinus albus]|uniref:Uncharacterized protein n=1 Tax=Lupinus albus TaxID=3870 RepID=A0A6A4R006_LUPAL|nr:hypothetical protein Lalb_Chr02g0149221 [Lupinus albus]